MSMSQYSITPAVNRMFSLRLAVGVQTPQSGEGYAALTGTNHVCVVNPKVGGTVHAYCGPEGDLASVQEAAAFSLAPEMVTVLTNCISLDSDSYIGQTVKRQAREILEEIENRANAALNGDVSRVQGEKEQLAEVARQRDDAIRQLLLVERDLAKMKNAAMRQQEEIQQILGKALGFPHLKNCPEIGGKPDDEGVEVGEFTAESLAELAAEKIGKVWEVIDQLQAQHGAYVDKSIDCEDERDSSIFFAIAHERELAARMLRRALIGPIGPENSGEAFLVAEE